MRGPNAPDPCEDFYTSAGIKWCDDDYRCPPDCVCPYDGNRAMCDEQQGDHIEAYREEL